jgi:hypothetical protein
LPQRAQRTWNKQIGMLEWWNIGISKAWKIGTMEYWKIGFQGISLFPVIPSFHFSIIPFYLIYHRPKNQTRKILQSF